MKYALLRSHWGRGIASEAVAGLLDWAFLDHGLTRLVATVHPENRASQRVLEKAGFQVRQHRLDRNGVPELVFECVAAA